jgi:UDP-GlcNAc:undecaprenyl-phosphate GlcNAc-1-phosphate transferase
MQMCVILIGVLIPFFYFDYKEKILMWDSWTMFLWFMLATLAIISWWKIATVMAVFWIYAVDAIYVTIRRIIWKKNPLSWDFTHLHHRLSDIGFSQNQILILVFSLSFFFGITALFLDRSWKIIVFTIITIFVVFLSYFWEKVKKIYFKK